MIKKSLVFFFFFAISLILCSKPQTTGYPFASGEHDNDIMAYWYNCPKESIYWEYSQKTSWLQSQLHIYGKRPANSFEVTADVFLKNGKKVFSRTFSIKEEEKKKTDFDVSFSGDFFKITCPVQHLKENPGKINVRISSSKGNREKTVVCKYWKLYGKITDFEGRPLKGFVKVYPDAFENEVGIWSDAGGSYEIYLPERTYNCFYINDGRYKRNTLEGWAWHIIMDSHQKMDFKIGTGEVYTLNVWASNGGFATYLVSFRPMVLFTGKKEEEYTTKINGNKYQVYNIAPDLQPNDVKITINGKVTEILSMQPYFETGKKSAMKAYLFQVQRKKPTAGKQTICVEYNKTITVDGKELIQNSQGYFQFYNNFFGVSKYF